MTIHKEGYTSIALCILFILLLNAFIQFYYPTAIVVKWIVYVLSFVLFAVVVLFFRSPGLAIEQDDSWVLCPADGTVVAIEEVVETEFLKDKRIRLSVAMSPVNVRVNRNAISGVVKYFKYHPKSSAIHEQTTIVTENKMGMQILFRQVAGTIALRIVWYVKEGDTVQQGEELGFIKSGSLVELYLPLGTQLMVQIGEAVKSGRTVLAKLKVETKAVVKPVPEAPLSNTPAQPTTIIEHDVYLAPKKPAVKKAATEKKTANTASSKKKDE